MFLLESLGDSILEMQNSKQLIFKWMVVKTISGTMKVVFLPHVLPA
jgi:hypothetical protein